MDIVMLSLTFLAAVAVSGSVVLAFSRPIDGVLARLVPEEMYEAWSRCAKFAVFVASFGGGLRLEELSGLVTGGAAAALAAPQAMLEVMKSVAGALSAAAWALVAFFAAALAVHAARRVYESFRPAAPARERAPAAPAGRW